MGRSRYAFPCGWVLVIAHRDQHMCLKVQKHLEHSWFVGCGNIILVNQPAKRYVLRNGINHEYVADPCLRCIGLDIPTDCVESNAFFRVIPWFQHRPLSAAVEVPQHPHTDPVQWGRAVWDVYVQLATHVPVGGITVCVATGVATECVCAASIICSRFWALALAERGTLCLQIKIPIGCAVVPAQSRVAV